MLELLCHFSTLAFCIDKGIVGDIVVYKHISSLPTVIVQTGVYNCYIRVANRVNPSLRLFLCGIWSLSILFAQACLSKYLG